MSFKNICILLCSLSFNCCSGQAETAHAEKSPAYVSSARPDTTTLSAKQKAVLEKIYSKAIGDYIRLIKKEYKLTYDTLYFGRHKSGKPEDFPDIALPAKIKNTSIELISPEQGEAKQKGNKSLAYINLIGWVNEYNAAFIFVTFTNGFVHQFDCFINYTYNADKKRFEFENNRFVNYRSAK